MKNSIFFPKSVAINLGKPIKYCAGHFGLPEGVGFYIGFFRRALSVCRALGGAESARPGKKWTIFD